MKASRYFEVLITLLQARENLLVVGGPGIGKSDGVDQAVAHLKYDLLIWHPVVDDPTDYKGLPAAVPDGKGGDLIAKFLPFGELNKLIKAKKPTVVFFDDLGQAANAVQAAIMQLVLARRINGHKISDEVRFVAATNRRQDRAAVTGLITPLLDRFTTVITLEADLNDWLVWAANNNMPYELMQFLRFRSDLFNNFEPSRDMKKSATPRSIAGVGRLLNQKMDDYEVLAGAAGEAFATELVGFLQVWRNLPDIQQIVADPERVPVPEELSVRYATAGMLAKGMNEVNIGALVKYVERMPNEFKVLTMTDALRMNTKLSKERAYGQFIIKNQQIFASVGK